jgi:DnaJ-class molecular chaperone
MRDPYQVLGLAPGATKEEVEAAYRAAAKAAHPDQGGTDEAMAEVNAARDRIKAFLAGDAVYDPNDFDEPDPGAQHGAQQQPPPSGGGGSPTATTPSGAATARR